MPDTPNTIVLTYRYRVKDKHAAALCRMAQSVNIVWNYANDVQRHAVKWNRRWPSAFDLTRLTTGSCRGLGLSSETIDSINNRYAVSRNSHRKRQLRYRGRKSLGWVPFKGRFVRMLPEGFKFFGVVYSLWQSRPLPHEATIIDGGSFSQDTRGHWYLNVAIRLPALATRAPDRPVGIDLGLKNLATLSTGEKVVAPRLYRASEKRLAMAQRARKKALVRRINATIANQRKDFLHKVSRRIVRDFDVIVVGDVSPTGFAKTNLAKSIHDAGWCTFRTMLRYKAIGRGAVCLDVDERYSTQCCSDCGSIGGPKGREALVIRAWTCSDCGAVHDRDVNAARCILRRGLATLKEEPARLAA